MKESKTFKAHQIAALATFKRLAQRAKTLPSPLSDKIVTDYGKNPFLILISCILSLRARDTVTYPICKQLFAKATTPQQMLAIPLNELEKILKRIGFYRRKAQLLHSVSYDIIHRFHNKVPSTKEELLSIKGVGIKTANLVLAEAFDKPAICVDTHVQRLSNRFGWVDTKTPQQTEKALQELFSKRYWSEINDVLVKWGQNRCKQNPATCPYHDLCHLAYGTRRK